MRISFLFLLAALLCGLVAVSVAIDRPRQISSSRFESVAGIVRPDELGRAVRDPVVLERLGREPAQEEDVTCYTVQSYLVKRQSPDSDVVEPAGYSTCQRASRYGVKTTEESGKAPSH